MLDVESLDGAGYSWIAAKYDDGLTVRRRRIATADATEWTRRWRREHPEKYAAALVRDRVRKREQQEHRDVRIWHLIAPYVVAALVQCALEKQARRAEVRERKRMRWQLKMRLRRAAMDPERRRAMDRRHQQARRDRLKAQRAKGER